MKKAIQSAVASSFLLLSAPALAQTAKGAPPAGKPAAIAAKPAADAAKPAAAGARMSKEDAVKFIDEVAERRRLGIDMKIRMFLDEQAKGQKVVREGLLYAREKPNQMLLLFTKPKTEEGNGYLRSDANMFYYDSRVGKWERRTDREQLAGTNLRRSDLDSASFTEDYEPVDDGETKVGKVVARQFTLTAREGKDVAFPIIKLWYDKDYQELKREDYALSGKKLRTRYVTKALKVFSPVKKVDVLLPGEIRIYDEVEKDRLTVVVWKAVDLGGIEDNVFTKAWLESKSR